MGESVLFLGIFCYFMMLYVFIFCIIICGSYFIESVSKLCRPKSTIEHEAECHSVSTIFGKEVMSGMLAIINASEQDYNDLSNAIGNSKDAAQDMADTMLDNLAGSMTLI